MGGEGVGRTVIVLMLWYLLANTPPVSFLRPRAFASDREDIYIQVQVEPHAANRSLVVAAVDADFVVRRTDVELDGERAARTHRFWWRSLPVGEYVLLAVTERGLAQHPLQVIGTLH